MTFIPYPKEVDEREERLKSLFGECYDCKNHCESCRICNKSGMPLTYPISGCPGHDSKYGSH